MRLTTIRADAGTRAARVEAGGRLVVLEYDDVGALIASGSEWRQEALADGEMFNADEVAFAPLVTAPENIFCVGLNYRDHAAEANLELLAHPTIFAKYRRSLIGPYDDLVLPANAEKVDWEVELGVVIGSPARHVDVAGARAAIAGYTIVNDVSMRDWQRRTSQYLQGKSFEASTPVGPFLVTADELSDPLDLSLRCSVDGVVMQESRTSQLVFSPGEICSYISQFITLEPGDLIATGTPGGIGSAQDPPTYLSEGQLVTTTFQGLGEQRNRCVPPSVAVPAVAAIVDGCVTTPALDRKDST
jgi:acylpyruvate hydrolase